MQIVKTLRVLLPPHVTFFHVPNGGKRSKAEAARLKAMGTRAGVPDLIFIHQGRFLGIELKTEDGRLSPEQDRCIADLMLAGADVDVCRSLDAVLARLAAWGIPMKGEVT